MTETLSPAKKMLRTQEGDRDYVVAVGDTIATLVDAGGRGERGHSEGEVYIGGECHRVMVRYSMDGLSGVSLAKPDNLEEWISYEAADEQPDDGTLWLPPLDYLPEIRTLPETKIEEVLRTDD